MDTENAVRPVEGWRIQREAVPPGQESGALYLESQTGGKPSVLKPTDKAIFGMVGESPGRNASEPTGGPDTRLTPEAELSVFKRRQHGSTNPDRRVDSLRRGGRGSTVTRVR
jgi:hypothetical protein